MHLDINTWFREFSRKLSHFSVYHSLKFYFFHLYWFYDFLPTYKDRGNAGFHCESHILYVTLWFIKFCFRKGNSIFYYIPNLENVITLLGIINITAMLCAPTLPGLSPLAFFLGSSSEGKQPTSWEDLTQIIVDDQSS